MNSASVKYRSIGRRLPPAQSKEWASRLRLNLRDRRGFWELHLAFVGGSLEQEHADQSTHDHDSYYKVPRCGRQVGNQNADTPRHDREAVEQEHGATVP